MKGLFQFIPIPTKPSNPLVWGGDQISCAKGVWRPVVSVACCSLVCSLKTYQTTRVRRLCSGFIFQIQRASNESHYTSSPYAGESKREKLGRAEEHSCQSCAWNMRKIRSGRRKPCLGWCSCARRNIKDNLCWSLILSLTAFTSCYLALHWGKKKKIIKSCCEANLFKVNAPTQVSCRLPPGF